MTTAELIERLERADGPSRELDVEIAKMFGPERRWLPALSYGYGVYANANGSASECLHYTASIDAAMTLVPKGQGRWPQLYYISPNPNNTTQGHRWEIWTESRAKPYRGHHKKSVVNALCIAALKAKEADNG